MSISTPIRIQAHSGVPARLTGWWARLWPDADCLPALHALLLMVTGRYPELAGLDRLLRGRLA